MLPQISLFAHLLSLSVSYHVPCSFSSDAGNRAERMSNTECVCVWVCAFHCLWGHEIVPKPQGTSGTALPRRRACLFSSIHASSSSAPPPFVFAQHGWLWMHYQCACMCDSSQLVAHPFVLPATFIPTSEPSVHQSLSSCVLLRRVTDTRRH